MKKPGTMSGLKLVSGSGHVAYRSLSCAGGGSSGTSRPRSTELNYSFTFTRTSDYNGRNANAYVFRVRPKKKRMGLFNGDLWLDSASAESLRLWGDLVKSPSIFIRRFRFVQDYQRQGDCMAPVRLAVTAQTRIVGAAELIVWTHRTAQDYVEAANPLALP